MALVRYVVVFKDSNLQKYHGLIIIVNLVLAYLIIGCL